MGLYHPSSTIVFSASHKLLLKIYYRNGAICYRGMTSTPHNHVPWCLTMGCSCVYSYFKLFTYFIRGNFYSSNVLLRERRGLVWETGDSIKSLSLNLYDTDRLELWTIWKLGIQFASLQQLWNRSPIWLRPARARFAKFYHWTERFLRLSVL